MAEWDTGEFSVYQWFKNGDQERVRQYVSAEEAMEAFLHYCTSVGARMGMTVRVIIIDGGDYTNAEWKFEEGIVYPEEQRGLLKRGLKK